MKAKRLLSLLLTLAMMLSIVAMSAGTAFAAGDDKAIAGVEVLGDKMNSTKAAQVHYGDMTWRVIGYNGVEKSVAAPEGMLALFSDDFLSIGYFNKANGNAVYAGSLLQQVMDNAAKGLFSKAELAAIVPRYLEVGVETGVEKDKNNGNKSTLMCDGVAVTAVEDAILWPLSTAEARATNTAIRSMASGTYINGNGKQETTIGFWLRSPGYTNSTRAAVVYHTDGITVTEQGVASRQSGVRPAFNLKMESVLLVSTSGAKVVTGVAAVADYKKTEWKLTVLDESRNFTATVGAENGNVVTVNYTGAKTGSNEFLSVVIKNAVSGGVTEYGRLKNLTSANGSVDIDLTGIDMKGKELYVFNEQYNGGAKDDNWKTDFGSKLVKLEVSMAPAVSQAAKDTQAMINVLPEADDFTLEDKEAVDAINAAKAAFDALPAEEKTLITTDKLDKALEFLKTLQDEQNGTNNGEGGTNNGEGDTNNGEGGTNNGEGGTNNGEGDANTGDTGNKDDEKKPDGGKTVSNGVVIGLWIALVVILCASIVAAVIFILKMKKLAPKAEVAEVAAETEEVEAVQETEETTEEESEE